MKSRKIDYYYYYYLKFIEQWKTRFLDGGSDDESGEEK